MSLETLSKIAPSKIVLNDQGNLVGLRPSSKGNYTTAAAPNFPSRSEFVELLAQLKEAEKALAEAESELQQLHDE